MIEDLTTAEFVTPDPWSSLHIQTESEKHMEN